MKNINVVSEAINKSKSSSSNVIKFKMPEQLTDKEILKITNLVKELMIFENKLITKSESIYNDESFTNFKFHFKLVTVKSLNIALSKMTEIAMNYCNMHGTMKDHEKIVSINQEL